MTLAEDFFRLFAGLERSHGRYVVPGNAKLNGEGKLHDTAWAKTLAEPVTLALWEDHLAGRAGLGITPIRDDGSCRFGAIDIDIYKTMNLQALVKHVVALNLPFIVCRTKSGGAHLYVFFSEPVPAKDVAGKLLLWTKLFDEFSTDRETGKKKIEVFPKQTQLSAGSKGSWINMPYVGGASSLRYALDPTTCDALTPEAFISLAATMALSAAQFHSIEVRVETDLLKGAPPCLIALVPGGFFDWENSACSNLSIYAKKRYGAAKFAEHAHELNEALLKDPLSRREMAMVVKSISKRPYSYMCRQEPICGVCDRETCITREFGIGRSVVDAGVEFGELVKLETDPPTWLLSVNEGRIELTTAEFLNQKLCREKVVSELNILTQYIKNDAWDEMVRGKLAQANVVLVPEEGTKRGQFWAHVERFCTSRVKGRNLDEIIMGKPFTGKLSVEQPEERTYFCSTDLMQYLQQHRFNGCNEKDMYGWLRERGVGHHFKVLKAKGVNFWSVPAFSEQSEPFDIPRSDPPERM